MNSTSPTLSVTAALPLPSQEPEKMQQTTARKVDEWIKLSNLTSIRVRDVVSFTHASESLSFGKIIQIWYSGNREKQEIWYAPAAQDDFVKDFELIEQAVRAVKQPPKYIFLPQAIVLIEGVKSVEKVPNSGGTAHDLRIEYTNDKPKTLNYTSEAERDRDYKTISEVLCTLPAS